MHSCAVVLRPEHGCGTLHSKFAVVLAAERGTDCRGGANACRELSGPVARLTVTRIHRLAAGRIARMPLRTGALAARVGIVAPRRRRRRDVGIDGDRPQERITITGRIGRGLIRRPLTGNSGLRRVFVRRPLNLSVGRGRYDHKYRRNHCALDVFARGHVRPLCLASGHCTFLGFRSATPSRANRPGRLRIPAVMAIGARPVRLPNRQRTLVVTGRSREARSSSSA